MHSLFSVYYDLLKEEQESNYCSIYYFYERILKIIKNNNLKEKLKQIKFKLKSNKNFIEKKNIKNEKIEFNDDELIKKKHKLKKKK